MIKLDAYLSDIQTHLIHTHSDVLAWFDADADLRAYRPEDGGWTISEILEHIALTSRYLMILVDKGAKKALKNIHDKSLKDCLANYHYDLSAINAIGIHKSFEWIRPEHMEPTGERSDLDVKAELIDQTRRCLNHLESLKNGEGLLYETMMSVNDLGKINVYEYIYFLSNHAARHIQQIEENKSAFLGVD